MNKSFYPLVLLALSGIAYGTQPTLTTNRLSNAVVSTNGAPLTFNLSRYFNTPATTNMVRVITSLTDSKTNPLGFTLQLYPTNAPKTVANFLAYVNDGAYENTVFHRLTSINDGLVVLQTGGYKADPNLSQIATWGPVTNEYSIPNSIGTVAMAKFSGNPNSATDEWFINISDNSSTLNTNNNGGFTVFAKVVGNGMSNVVNKIAAEPTYGYGNFSELPLQGITNGQSQLMLSNLLSVTRVATLPYFALSSDPDSYATQVNGTNLTVTYVGSINPPSNPVTISVFAYDTNGLTTNSSFQVWYQTNAVQTITFPSISNQPYSTAPVSLPTGPTWPTSSDGVPITSLNFSGPLSIATNGNAYFTGVGTITFTAISAGNFFYKPATNMISFTVTPAPQTITFPQILPTNQIYSTNPFILTNAPYSSSGIPVNITIKQGSPMNVISNKFYMTGVGTVTLVASNATNVSLYQPATPTTNMFTIVPAPQTITFPTISNQVLPVTPFLLKATASSRLPASYALISNSPASLTNGSTLRINGPGVITIVANQAGTNVYLPATPVTNSFRAASNQTIGAFASIPNRTYTNPSASITITPIPKASSGLPVSFSVKSGPASLLATNSNSITISVLGAGAITVAANQPGNSNYFASTEVTANFTVAKASQTISSLTGLPSQLTNGIPPFAITIPQASSGLSNTTLLATGAGKLLSNNMINLTNAGTLTITVTNAGNSNYFPAWITTNIPVAKGRQTITFPTFNAPLLVGTTNPLSAIASSSLPVTYSLTPSNANVAIVSNSIVVRSFTTNSYKVVASQLGNNGWTNATPVTNSFTVKTNSNGGSIGGTLSIGTPNPTATPGGSGWIIK